MACCLCSNAVLNYIGRHSMGENTSEFIYSSCKNHLDGVFSESLPYTAVLAGLCCAMIDTTVSSTCLQWRTKVSRTYCRHSFYAIQLLWRHIALMSQE